MSRPHVLPNLVAAAMLLITFGDHPYGYYTALRWVVLIAAGVSTYAVARSTSPLLAWLFVGIAVLFNPIAPIYLDRSVWQLLDLATAVVLAAGCSIRVLPGTVQRT